jgi:hypothetical protein
MLVLTKDLIRTLITCLISGKLLTANMIKYPIPEIYPYPFDHDEVGVLRKFVLYSVALISQVNLITFGGSRNPFPF